MLPLLLSAAAAAGAAAAPPATAVTTAVATAAAFDGVPESIKLFLDFLGGETSSGSQLLYFRSVQCDNLI